MFLYFNENEISNKIGSILDKFSEILPNSFFVEPFFGRNNIFIDIYKNNNIKKISINNSDIWTSCLWTAIIRDQEELCIKLKEIDITIDYLFLIKDRIKNDKFFNNYVDVAANFLIFKTVYYDGIENIDDDNKIKNIISSRMNIDNTIKEIRQINKIINKKEISLNSCTIYEEEGFISRNNSNNIFLIDPPFFSDKSFFNHEILCDLLKKLESPWVLIYDNCEEIKRMYSWAFIDEKTSNFLKNNSRIEKELIIINKKYKYLLDNKKETIKKLF